MKKIDREGRYKEEDSRVKKIDREGRYKEKESKKKKDRQRQKCERGRK